MARTSLDNRQDQNAALNPGELHAAEQFSPHRIQSGIDQAEAFANDPANHKGETDNTRNIDEAKDQEFTPNLMNSSFGSNPKRQRQTFVSKVITNRKKLAIWGGVGGGLGALVFAAFVAILPLKLVGLVENMTSAAAQVPSYAVEQRTEYLVTRMLATRMMMLANGHGADRGTLAFCASGIACSLFTTYTSDYFEKKMDLSMVKRTNGRVEVRINAEGRDRLGTKAKVWTITTDAAMDESGIRKTINNIEIESNKEMKAYIKDRVSKNMHTSSAISRLFARNILMKKYGVTHWRGFEKTQKKLTDVKATFKAGLFMNTIGKVAPRTAMYMACLTGGAGCEKLLNSLADRIADTPDKPNATDEEKENKRATDAKNQNTIDSIRTSMSGITPDDAEGTDKVLSKIISNKILASAAGALGVATIADLILTGVHQVDNGAFEEIGYDLMKTATLGFALGDDTGILTNKDRIIAGDIDPEVLETIMPMFDNVEESAVFAQQNGLDVAADSENRITKTCQGDDGPTTIKLPPGQLVCPEYLIVKDLSSNVTNNALWDVLATAAGPWNTFVHPIFATMADAMGAILNMVPGFSQAMGKAAELLEPAIKWFFGLIVDVPLMGSGATGAQNYDALGGGVAVSQNIIMEEGAELSGGGGSVLSNGQVATIQQETLQAEEEYYNSQTVIARTFNPSLRGSFAQRFIASMPTTITGALRTPATLGRSLTTTTNAAAVMTSNPFNLPLYGYAANDPVLTADPGKYDEASCAASAQARADSFGRHPGQLVATYAIADPCALEKMVVGTMLNEAGVKNNPYVPALDSSSAMTPDQGTPDASDGGETPSPDTTTEWASPVPASVRYSGTSGYGVSRSTGQHPGEDIAYSGDILAACTGVVTRIDNNGEYTKLGDWRLSNQLVVDCGGGILTRYHHYYFKTVKPGIKVGVRVTAGTPLARVGDQGNSTGVHLHFEIRTDDKQGFPGTKNPVEFLSGKGVKL